MKNILAAAIFFLILLPSVVQAQAIERECDGHMPCNFDQFKAGVLKWYNVADINKDGIIDATEQGQFWKAHASDILPACHDMQDIKVLSLNHVPTDEQLHKAFAQLDVNADGVIDKAEDQQATMRLNQTCALLHDPQVQQLQAMLKQLQNQSAKNPAPKPVQ